MKYTLTFDSKTTNKLKKLIKDFDSIETKKDLDKRKLSLSDFDVIKLILIDLFENRQSDFMQKNVKNYMEKFNFICEEKGIGWTIKID